MIYRRFSTCCIRANVTTWPCDIISWATLIVGNCVCIQISCKVAGRLQAKSKFIGNVHGREVRGRWDKQYHTLYNYKHTHKRIVRNIFGAKRKQSAGRIYTLYVSSVVYCACLVFAERSHQITESSDQNVVALSGLRLNRGNKSCVSTRITATTRSRIIVAK